jgi:hypothetical protein
MTTELVITAAINGAIPDALLEQVPGQRDGIRLAFDAAASMGRVCAEVEGRFGWRPLLNTAYRTVGQQNLLLARGQTTVPGGRSEHGLGRASDVNGLQGFQGQRYGEFVGVAGEHGWYQPIWATTFRPEPWHHEYDPGRDRHLGGEPAPVITREWDEMATQDEVKAAAKAAVLEVLQEQGLLQKIDIENNRSERTIASLTRVEEGLGTVHDVALRVANEDWLNRVVESLTRVERRQRGEGV